MKKAIILLVLILLSCNQKKNEVKSIELIAYNYKNDNSKWVPETFLYASLDTLGNSINLRKTDSINSIGYAFKVDSSLILKILDDARDKDESYFTKKDTFFLGCYLGPVIRFKISYENGKEISFNYHDRNYDKESKFYLYKALYDDLLNNPKVDPFKKIQFDLVKQKEKKFLDYTFNKDTLSFQIPPPYPPMPKIDEVKFIKK